MRIPSINISLFIFALIFFACNTKQSKNVVEIMDHTAHMISNNTGYADSVNAGIILQDTLKGSPERVAMQTIGKTHVHIKYHSPGVKGRIVWGGLVPYNTIWVTGAHTATSITFNNPIVIGNTKVKAGTYAIFTIPGEKEWTFILNHDYQQHLTDNYSADKDVLRVNVKPIVNTQTQRLTYTIEKQSENVGKIIFAWEKIRIEIPFELSIS